MASPSSRRREGRKAYENGYLHSDCPYKNPSDVDDWLEGWEQGYQEATAEVERASVEEEAWADSSFGCPWRDLKQVESYPRDRTGWCMANDRNCCRDNCAPYYWAKEVRSESE